MTGHSQYEFRNTALDPDLLSAPFGVQTNWHVITGAPSCGKTTLINQLAEAGYRTVPEGARLYMEAEIASGRSLDELRADVATLQRGISNMHLRIERDLRAADFAFLDRAVPDCMAWHRLFGLDPNEVLPDCFQHRYASVFILDSLPLDLDGLRFSDEALAGFLDAWHVRDYHALGYQVVRVPVLPPEARLAFILEKLSEAGWMPGDETDRHPWKRN